MSWIHYSLKKRSLRYLYLAPRQCLQSVEGMDILAVEEWYAFIYAGWQLCCGARILGVAYLVTFLLSNGSMHSYTAAAEAPLPLVHFSPEDPFGSEEWLCALRLLFSNSAELLTLCHYLFCKQYSQVGYFVVGAPLSGCLLLLLLQNCSLT